MAGCETQDGSNRRTQKDGLGGQFPFEEESEIGFCLMKATCYGICWTFTTHRSWVPVSESLRSDVWRPRYLEAITEQKGERYGNMFMDRNLALMDVESQWACTVELLF